MGKPEENRALGTPKCTSTWMYNIKMDLRERARGGTDWTDLAQERDQ
jgi:hypothetical protein